MAETWLLLRMGSNPAAENMALDEALLETAATRTVPLLRFYSWTEPAATFGYFQKYKDVQRMTALRPVVRRPTGGGLVPHDHDWTYSLVFAPGTDWYGLSAVESYRRVHVWIGKAFTEAGLSTQLAPQRAAPSKGQCFIGAEQFDVVWKDRKIAGAAQRRTKQGLLIQGSIQPPAGILRTRWEKAFLESAAVVWETFVLDRNIENRVQWLVETKYSQTGYNQRR